MAEVGSSRSSSDCRGNVYSLAEELLQLAGADRNFLLPCSLCLLWALPTALRS